MEDLAKRLGNLPSDRRKLLQQLLARNGVQDAILENIDQEEGAKAESEVKWEERAMNIITDAISESALVLPPNPSPSEVKAYHRSIYNKLNDQLNSAPFAKYIRFCNYGYVGDTNRQFSPIKLPQYLLNKNTIKLVLEVIGDCNPNDCEILDVGCGRGGTISVINDYFHPKRVAGIDLSTSAIAFCRRNNPHSFVSYFEGDAEELPFLDKEFDIITNIESSHSYPTIINFYQEVERVLRPGGYFLYADLFRSYEWDKNIQVLEQIGFLIERNYEITHNVLLSCDQTASSKLDAYDSGNNREFMANFLGIPESQVYMGMQNGTWNYRNLKLRKS